MRKWEYLWLPNDSALADEIMNELGRQGWELVSVLFRSDYGVFHYYFKRPIEDKSCTTTEHS